MAARRSPDVHPSKPEPLPIPRPEVESIKIRVFNGATYQGTIHFRIKKTVRLGRVMDAFCERTGLQSSVLRFLFGGRRINSYDTPETLEMVDNDEIEAFSNLHN